MSGVKDPFEILADEITLIRRQVDHLQRTSLDKDEAEAFNVRVAEVLNALAEVATEALKDPKISKWLASTLRKNATRDVDQKEIAGLLADLDARAQSAGAGEA